MNAAEYQAAILSEVEGGADEKNALFSLALPVGVTAGNWDISFAGSVATVAYNVMPGALQSAVEALDTVGVGNVRVEGSPKGPYCFEMTGALARQPVPVPTAAGAGLTPPAALVVTQTRYPVAYRYQTEVVTVWNNFATSPAYGGEDLELRRYRVLEELLRRECDRLSERVNITDGIEQAEASDMFKAKRQLMMDVRSQIETYRRLANQSQNNSSFGGSAKATADARSNYQAAQRWSFFGRGNC